MELNVDVVVVTYNRLEKLKKALACYENQTLSFRSIIIVDNHSSDGTYEYLEEWKSKQTPFVKYIIHAEDNLGGSGGYYLGQKKAMELNPDWLFLADDDAYPVADMMEKFYDYAGHHLIGEYAAICGTVFHPDDSIDLQHRSRYLMKGKRFVQRVSSTLSDYEKPEFKIDFLSYVGVFLNGKALKKVGLVNPDFFIYQDDSEHSLRLKKYGDVICVPCIRIVHDDMIVGDSKPEAPLVSWKDYYFERNGMVLLKKHFPWAAIHQTRKLFAKKMKGELKGDRYGIMKWEAVKHAWLGRMGKHPVYVPGWEIKK